MYTGEISHTEDNSRETDSLKVLKDELSVLRKGILQSDENIEVKYDIMKEFISTFIATSLDAAVTESVLFNQLHALCYKDMIISTKLSEWTFDELKRLIKHDSQECSLVPSSSPAPPQTSFFSKEHVSNCLLLCKTVASCDRSNYSKFLSHHCHDFGEVSFSHSPGEGSKLEPYLIAKVESRNELYVAFLGEPHLPSWQEKYNTFTEGMCNLVGCGLETIRYTYVGTVGCLYY